MSHASVTNFREEFEPPELELVVLLLLHAMTAFPTINSMAKVDRNLFISSPSLAVEP